MFCFNSTRVFIYSTSDEYGELCSRTHQLSFHSVFRLNSVYLLRLNSAVNINIYLNIYNFNKESFKRGISLKIK